MRKVLTFSAAGAAFAAIAAAALAATGGGGTAHPVSSTSSPRGAAVADLVAHTRASASGHLVSGAAGSATEPAGTRPAAGTTSLLVRFASGSSAAQQVAAVAAHGGTQRAAIPALALRVVDVPSAHAAAVAAAYRADRSVRSVEVDSTRHARATPSDPSYASQWALPQIGWDQVHGAVNPAGTATIAVLDTGVDGSHEDLAGRLVPGYSAFAGSDPASDPNGHGTWMAGIAAAATDNAAGIAGVAYSGVSIMPVQVLDASGTGQDSDIVNGVIWAADHGADVIVMSFSNTGYSQALQDAASYAWSKGAVLVAATGNDASSTITYPAGDTYVMGVSGTDQNDALASESNFGVDTFVAAPSEDVLTTDAGGGYRAISGTSASAAIVAGVAAFERALDGSLSNGAIDGRIARNAAPAGTTDQTGNGRVDMLRTVADTATDAVIPVGAGAGGGSFVGPYSDAAAATDGTGTMTVTPTSALAGSTGDSFTFSFRIPNKTGNFEGQSRILFPAGWTQPQTTSSSGPGFVSIVNPSNCATKTISSISGSTTTGFTVVVNTSCNSRKKYTLSYTNVTAPGAGAYTFTTATKLTSGTFTNIATSPVITVNPAGATSTTTTLARTAGTNPDLFGQSLTFTATVTASSGSNPTTGQGSVDFVDTSTSTPICSAVALSGNTATCTVNNLDSGAYTIQASYSGTTSAPAFAGSTSNTVNQTVNAAGTTTALTSNNNPSTVGSSVTFTATVTTTASGGTDPNGDGKVTFNDGATTVCATVALIGNVATCTTSSLTVGTHSMSAVYESDPTLADFTGSTGTLSQVVNAGAVTHFVVSGYPSPTTAGVAHSFTVTAKDSGNNTVAGYAGTVTFTSSDGSAVLPANYAFTGGGSGKDNGVHTFSATLETVGTQSITATDTAHSGITGAQTGIVVNPAGAATLVVSGYPSPSVEGSGGSVTVTAKDAYGNVATGYTGTVALSSTDTHAVLPGSHTFSSTDAGVYTFSGVVLESEGAQSITATDTASSGITGSQPVTVTDAALHATAGSAISATEGAPVSGTVATFTDDNPDATSADYTASIDWGDGSTTSGAVAASAGGFSVSGSHTYAEEGSDSVHVTITDAGGSTASASLSATVSDAALHATAASNLSLTEGAAFNGTVATFTDDDPAGAVSDYTASIDWGDGTTTTATVGSASGHFTVSGAHTYAEEGSFPISVSIRDAVSSTSASLSATVADAALHATAGPTVNAVEGAASGTVALAGLRDDDPNGAASDYTATVDWGDGSATEPATVAAPSGGSFPISSAGHTYAEDGTYTITVSIADAGGSTTTATLSAHVADAALHATAQSFSATEGAAFGGTVATFTDDDSNGTASDYTATINWGDGTTSSAGTVHAPSSGSFPVSGQHTYAEEGTYAVSITVDDAGGSSTTTGEQVIVADAALHATAATDPAPTEGAAFTAPLASFTDDDPAGALSDYSATVDWGDGSTSNGAVSATAGGFTVGGTHSYAEEGSFAISVTIHDAGGSSVGASLGAVVADAALHASGAAAITATEGAPSGTVTVASVTDDDPAGAVADYTATIDWGDGSAPQTATVGNPSGGVFPVTSGGHTYAEEGTYTATVSVFDVGGSSSTATTTVTVRDAALHATAAATINAVEGAATGSVSLASLRDDDPNGTTSDYTATVDWGDGSTDAATVGAPSAGSFPVSGAGHTYAEEGTYTVTVSVLDAGGSSTSTTLAAHVSDAALHAAAQSFSPTEGAAFSGTVATFTDDDPAGVPGDYTATINWGDGTPASAGTVNAPSGGSFPLSGAHTYAEEGTYTVSITISDAGGATTTFTGPVTVADAALHATAAADPTAIEGAAFTAPLAAFSDDDANGTTSDYTATVAWGDGSTSSGAISATTGGFAVGGTHTYAEEGSFPVTVSIRDSGGSSTTASLHVAVADAALHSTAAAAISGVEGAATGALPLASLHDDDPGGAVSDYTATVNWGDGTATQAATVGSPSAGSFPISSAGHVFAEEGTYTVTVAISDAGGSTTSTTLTATIRDAALHSAPASNLHATEGAATGTVALASLSDDDPGGAVSDYTATVNWGDGTGIQAATVGSPSGGSFPVSSAGHTYAEEGTYTVTVSVTDAGGSSTTSTLTATVGDALLHAVAQAIAPVEGAAFSGTVASFSDDDPAGAVGDYTATIDWGDGTSTSTGTVATSGGGFTVGGGHTYAEEGPFTVTTTISDAGGAKATATRQANVADAALSAVAVSPVNTFIDTSTGTVNVATFSDADPAGTVSDYAATINWGDGSPATSGGVGAMSGGGFVVTGSHTYTAYPAGGSYPVTVAISDVGGSTITVVGSATVSAIPVTVGTPSASPASVWFADSTTLSATISAMNGNGGPLQGTATFRVNGNPVAGIPVSVNTTTAAQTVTASIRLDQTVVPLGAGSYPITVTFTGSNANYQYYNSTSPASTGSLTVTQKPVALSYAGDWFVQDTATPSLSVVVDQSDGGDPSFVDYSKVHVTAQFSIYNGTGGLIGSVTAPVTNASTWSTTGLGSAKASWTGTLSDGSYQVVVTILSNGYVSGPDAPATLTSSPVTGSFVTGGGFISPDSTSNTPDTNHKGNFGITVKFNKSGSSLQGNSIYVYRLYMDVTTGAACSAGGGPNCRDVDVVVKSNSLSSLSVSPTSSTTANAVITGKFSVQYNDALNGTQYTQFGFGNGSFQINVTDGGSGGSNDSFGEVMRRPDGTLFHLGSYPGTTVSSSNGSAQQEPLGGGNITVHQ
jgi:hypothetical protein